MAFKENTVIQVARAIKTLLERGEKVSVRAITVEMGQGSFSTVAPILKKLKTQTQNFKNLAPLSDKLGEPIRNQPEKLLGQAEFAIEALEAENISLRAKTQELEMTKTKLAYYQRLYESLKEERESSKQLVTSHRDHEITYLRAELKTLNLHYAQLQREQGSEQDEKLLVKQLEVVKLQDEVAQLKLALQQVKHQLPPKPVVTKNDACEQQVVQLKRVNEKLQKENAKLIARLHEVTPC